MERDDLQKQAEQLLAEAEDVLSEAAETSAEARHADVARDWANEALDLLGARAEDESLHAVIEALAHASREMAIAKDPSIVVPDRKVQANGFTFSGYWHSWSRVLAVGHPAGRVVEVTLTPHNHGQSAWDTEVRPIFVRAHCTPLSRDRGDIFLMELPPSVRRLMVASLGEELTNRLLTENFLDQIDWDLYRQKQGSGPGLEDIRRP
jgi:hypothetical protein